MVRELGGQAQGGSTPSQRRYLDPRDRSTPEVSGQVRPLQVSLARRVVIRSPDRYHAAWTDRVDVAPADESRVQG